MPEQNRGHSLGMAPSSLEDQHGTFKRDLGFRGLGFRVNYPPIMENQMENMWKMQGKPGKSRGLLELGFLATLGSLFEGPHHEDYSFWGSLSGINYKVS